MPKPLLECQLCARRYDVAAVSRREYFAETLICRQCYGAMQRQNTAVSCFGKRDKKGSWGYDKHAIECQSLCPDRSVCAAVVGAKGFRYRRLEHEAWRWLQRVLRMVALIDNQPRDRYFDRLGMRDQCRLLNLRVWSLRYKVSCHEILGILLEYYARVRRKGSRSIGIRASTLCGVRSRTIIKEAVQERYPGSENKIASRAEAQRILVGGYRRYVSTILGPIEQVAVSYQQKVGKERLRLRGLGFQRPWRQNPWR